MHKTIKEVSAKPNDSGVFVRSPNLLIYDYILYFGSRTPSVGFRMNNIKKMQKIGLWSIREIIDYLQHYFYIDQCLTKERPSKNKLVEKIKTKCK